MVRVRADEPVSCEFAPAETSASGSRRARSPPNGPQEFAAVSQGGVVRRLSSPDQAGTREERPADAFARATLTCLGMTLDGESPSFAFTRSAPFA